MVPLYDALHFRIRSSELCKIFTTNINRAHGIRRQTPRGMYRFIAGNFSAKMTSKNTFGCIEMDKVIEVAINKDTKCPAVSKNFTPISAKLTVGLIMISLNGQTMLKCCRNSLLYPVFLWYFALFITGLLFWTIAPNYTTCLHLIAITLCHLVIMSSP